MAISAGTYTVFTQGVAGLLEGNSWQGCLRKAKGVFCFFPEGEAGAGAKGGRGLKKLQQAGKTKERQHTQRRILTGTLRAEFFSTPSICIWTTQGKGTAAAAAAAALDCCSLSPATSETETGAVVSNIPFCFLELRFRLFFTKGERGLDLLSRRKRMVALNLTGCFNLRDHGWKVYGVVHSEKGVQRVISKVSASSVLERQAQTVAVRLCGVRNLFHRLDFFCSSFLLFQPSCLFYHYYYSSSSLYFSLLADLFLYYSSWHLLLIPFSVGIKVVGLVGGGVGGRHWGVAKVLVGNLEGRICCLFSFCRCLPSAFAL